MKEPKLVADGWHRCDNCSEIWNGRDLSDIANLYERIDAGGVVPSGECPDPECGALCYPHKPNPVKARSRHGLGKGYCADHGEFKMDSETTTCPTCEDAEDAEEDHAPKGNCPKECL